MWEDADPMAQRLMTSLNWIYPKLPSSRLQTSFLHREPQGLWYPTHHSLGMYT